MTRSRPWFAGGIALGMLVFLGLGLVGAVCLVARVAHGHDGSDSLSRWYSSLKRADGLICCSAADCRMRPWRMRAGRYEVEDSGSWLPVPDEAVVRRNDMPEPDMVSCVWGGEVRCVVMPVEG